MVKFVRVHVAYMSCNSFTLLIQIIDDKKEVPNDTENYLVRACLFFN